MARQKKSQQTRVVGLLIAICCSADHLAVILFNLAGQILKVNLLDNLSIFQFLNKLFMKKS
jgi:hypothetical protein